MTDRSERPVDRPHALTVLPEEEGGHFIECPDLPCSVMHVEDVSETGPMAEGILRLWRETAHAHGMDMASPLLRLEESWSGRFVVRLPGSLHRQLSEPAAREGVSLNEWVTTPLARAGSAP